MKKYSRILTFQDISCVGQCSLTVALPILSACSHETAILPSAVLSTHTGGFTGYTFRDLTSDIPLIIDHWEKEGIKFDALYTGYLGNADQIDYVIRIADELLSDNGKLIVDPVLGDGGKLYVGFDSMHVSAMRKLCKRADVILPNITEASFITDNEYREEYDEAYIKKLMSDLTALGCDKIVLTGVGYESDKTGAAIQEGGKLTYYTHTKYPRNFHGTGDVFASAFVGAYVKSGDLYRSAKIGADYTFDCIKCTADDPDHFYGVKFELAIPKLVEYISSLG